MKKTAFTLMEILISLTIIGIIVVLTIPNFIGDTSSKASVTLLKSTYSQFGDALKQAMIDQSVTGVIVLDFPGSTNSQKISAFMNKYFDVSKDCGENADQCFASVYRNVAGEQIAHPFLQNGNAFSESVLLSNGAAVGVCIDFDTENEEDMYVLIDTNGPKKPNVFGKDTFAAWIHPNGEVGTVADSDSLDSIKSDCKMSGGVSEDAYTAEACFDLLRAKNWDIEHYLD